jgi:hypothetical protein
MAVLENGEIKQEVHLIMYPAGQNDVGENLDIVHLWGLVEGKLPASNAGRPLEDPRPPQAGRVEASENLSRRE